MLGNRCPINRHQLVGIDNEFSVVVVLVPDFDFVSAEVQLWVKIDDPELVAIVERSSDRGEGLRVFESEFVDDIKMRERDRGPAWILSNQDAVGVRRVRSLEDVAGHQRNLGRLTGVWKTSCRKERNMMWILRHEYIQLSSPPKMNPTIIERF
jgi:hypothetical protein